jgi:thioredoxin-related protein
MMICIRKNSGKVAGTGVVRAGIAWCLAAGLLAGCDSQPLESVTPVPVGQQIVQAEPASVEPVTDPSLAEGMVNPGYEEKPEWFANSFLDIRADIQEAAAGNKRLLLYFYQDGCPYCKKLLDTNFALADTVKRTRDHFEVIAINIWGDREVTDHTGAVTTEKEFARALRVMFTPTLLFMDEQGGVVLRLNGYYPPHLFNAALDYGSKHSGSDPGFREYLAETDPVPSVGVLHSDPSFLSPGTDLAARNSGKPLLVMFEQKDCAPCDELHADILQRPEARTQLARFDIVLLEMWSQDPVKRPDGKTGSVTDWARELDVKYAPTLVYFDTGNKEVFRTEAYLKAFHILSSMDYVASGAYREYPEFQRFISARADELEAQGITVELME